MIPPVVGRFVAGETSPVALDHARTLNGDGVGAILNLLGEHYHERAHADRDAEAYRRLLADLDGSGLRACVSVKPSQVGLGVGEDAFRENAHGIVTAAADHDGFVWLDMEDSSTTDATLDAFEALAGEFGDRVGVCVQANLRRTRGDLERLACLPGKVRLVKGAYDEPAPVAYTDREAVDAAFREDLRYMFGAFEDGVALGSHDPAMVTHALSLSEEYGTPFEIQMLMGVREDAQRELAEAGHEVWQYVPYGPRWLSYFYRRLRERRENVGFALRALAGG
jgi:proline dehydrogenase